MDCHGWAFPSRKYPGRHQLPASVGKRLKRILSGYSAHTLRHHYATQAYLESKTCWRRSSSSGTARR